MELKTTKMKHLSVSLILVASANLTAQAESVTFQGIPFVKIPPGCFEMGGDKGNKDTLASELPVHKVCITKGFYMGETEVTQGQWEDLMSNNPSKVKSKHNPIDRVTWQDTQDFIERLNKMEGRPLYRLPTEAEWEYAARAGSGSLYSFGNDPDDLPKYAWFGNEGYHGSSKEVAQKKPNAFGLYDMHGNVWEWVQDWYDDKYYASSPENDPKGPESGKMKVYRGGSWVAKGFNLRSSLRYSSLPVARSNDLGFRLVRDE